jgi:lipopolysaccharide/colanic/teichoic acid biosynthesis glycosyltransferase
MYKRYFKRSFDLAVIFVFMVITLPVLIFLAALVWIQCGLPIFFRQMRPGLNGRPFLLWKFRTMTNDCDEAGNLLNDSSRLTSFGRFLRRWSLDELPELLNVLKGNMSLVGPRPLLMRYYEYFTDEEKIRFTVRPGITGLAQVSGRNNMSWDARIAADMEYVKKCSLLMDLRILLSTFSNCLSQEGLHVDPGSVMADFDEERKKRIQFRSPDIPS